MIYVYRFTYQQQMVHCQNETDFVTKIANLLKINAIYVSSSPESKHLVIVK